MGKSIKACPKEIDARIWHMLIYALQLDDILKDGACVARYRPLPREELIEMMMTMMIVISMTHDRVRLGK